MESHEAIICRFCLKFCKEFQSMEGDIKEDLAKVLPKIDLTVVDETVICTNCVEVLLNCLDFKTTCFHTHDYIVPFVHHAKNSVKLDLLDVYLSKNKNSTDILEGRVICACCISPVNNCSSISLDVEERDVALDNMIQQCVPELDLSIIRRAVICPSCHVSLENYFHFVTNCLIVEEKIKKYCETLDVNSIGQTELGHLRYLKNELDANLVNKIKVETQFCEERENDDKGEIANRHDIIKLERSSRNDAKNVTGVGHIHKSYLDNIDNLKFNNEEKFVPKTILDYKQKYNNVDIKTEEIFCDENGLKEESCIEMVDQKFLLNEEIEIKTDEQDFTRFQELEVATKLHSEQTSLKSNLKDDFIMHKNPSEATMYKCDSCSFQTKRKYNLMAHSLQHKDPSEVTMYKCDSCSFETKYGNYLTCHSLIHRNPSEVTMYRCDSCSFQTKRKGNLRAHSRLHKTPSEVIVYKCDSCSYQTQYGSYLKRHLTMHMSPSEVTMYKCDSCSFQTKYGRYLKRHSLMHMNPSEVTMYKCDSCPYQTKYERYLKRHLLVHMNPLEVTMYGCDSCSYQTKFKGDLKRHVLVHKIPQK